MNQYPQLTAEELKLLMQQLSIVFDVVRIVDVEVMRELKLVEGEPEPFVVTECTCCNFWDRNERCQNCTSSVAFHKKARLTKFEFRNHEVFNVTSQYITVDGEPCVLEIAEKNSDPTLYGAFGKDAFVDRIQEYSNQLYVDPLTRIRNRRYFDEQIFNLNVDAVALLDVDNFKQLNEKYGRIPADKALREVAKAIKKSVRTEDNVVRYHDDEFLIGFTKMPKEALAARLNYIRKLISEIDIVACGINDLSISVGAQWGRNQARYMVPQAENALREAKQTKNCVILHDDE